MRLKSVAIRGFKRFTELTISNLPDTARLIMLAGPNGSGKSSFFDALLTWYKWNSQKDLYWDSEYHGKVGLRNADRWRQQVEVQFHDFRQEAIKKAIYLRSAYRNDPEFDARNIRQTASQLDENRIRRTIENDAAVRKNYERLAARVFDVFDRPPMMTDEFVAELIDPIRGPIRKLFPDLTLDGLKNPLEDGTFRFTKGTSQGFAFKNLSGGEKAAFDLILDLAVARRAYDDTVYCIDEPESHMNARVQAELLSVLLELMPDNCQLVLATHSIGMMRKARDIEIDDPGSVAFLDFEGLGFDESRTMEPIEPNLQFWANAHEIALDDLASLVVPERVIICEGEPNSSHASPNYAHDARCYENIFRNDSDFSQTRFVPGGTSGEIERDKRGIEYVVGILAKGVEVIRLIDRDDKSAARVQELRSQGISVLSRRSLESFLFDDQILAELAIRTGIDGAEERLLSRVSQILDGDSGYSRRDLKGAMWELFLACKDELALSNCGENPHEFMRETLAPLVRRRSDLYEELRADVLPG